MLDFSVTKSGNINNTGLVRNEKPKDEFRVFTDLPKDMYIHQDKRTTYQKITPINSEQEFVEIFYRLLADKSFCDEWILEGANKYDTAIMPYAGLGDIHEVINRYLRLGEFDALNFLGSNISSEETVENYIKCLDYALKKTDEVYGKYKGFVFRNGSVDAQSKQYLSTSVKIDGALDHAIWNKPFERPYNIIFTKNGHKINEVQKKLGSRFADVEAEILLSPDHNYAKLKTLNPEMEKLRQNFIAKFKKKFQIESDEELKNKLKLDFWIEA